MGILTVNQKKILTNAGFIQKEIEEFDNAQTPDGKPQDNNFESGTFQSMIKSRTKWVHDLENRGWNIVQIVIQIKRFYTLKAGRSPFDFLKTEYHPPKKMNLVEVMASRKSAKDNVTAFKKSFRSKKGVPRFKSVIKPLKW